MTNESTNEPAIRKGMTCDELYYYRRFRLCGMAMILLLLVVMLCVIFGAVFWLYHFAPGVIGCVCVAVFSFFAMTIKKRDADHYWKRAFPRGDSDDIAPAMARRAGDRNQIDGLSPSQSASCSPLHESPTDSESK